MVGSSLMTDGWAQSKGTAKHTSKTVVNMQAQQAGGISVAFVSLSDGISLAGQHSLDLGTVSYASLPRNPNVQVRSFSDRFVVSTKVGLSLQDPTRHVATATLLAALAYPDSAHVVWLDGVRLGTTPQVVQGQVPLGKTSAHKLEIEVPTSLTEKNAELHNTIIFQVVPN
jgi:hypothetical protein